MSHLTPTYTVSKKNILTVAILTLASVSATAQAELTLSIYNPQERGIFPVSSEILYGDHEVLLIDAQFAKDDAKAIVNEIKKSGKPLTTIYISHGDPDYYFGLNEIQQAFPDAKILATPYTVEHIKKTQAAKLEYWGKILKEQAPTKIIIPDVLEGNILNFEKNKLEIKELDQASPDRSYVWIPELKAIVGGILLVDNMHVWMADSQTKKARTDWIAALKRMSTLNPEVIIPAHYIDSKDATKDPINFTINYIEKYENVLETSKGSDEVIKKMTAAYPNFNNSSSLETSAKVNMGEMAW